MPDQPLDPPPHLLDTWLDEVTAWVRDHVAGLGHPPASGPVGPAGEAIAERVSVPIPEAPLGDITAVLQRFDIATRAAFTANGPGYFAYVPGGGLPTAALADLLSGIANRFTGLAGPAPALVRLEADVLAWLASEVQSGPA
jgi:aromatic-L-amino-acid decarboxylase